MSLQHQTVHKEIKDKPGSSTDNHDRYVRSLAIKTDTDISDHNTVQIALI